MNIENHINSAEVYLDMARDKINSHDYDSALVSLAKAYAHTRQLMEDVLKLKRLKSEVTCPAGENTGGTKDGP